MDLSTISAFVSVAQERSFTAAAASLGITASGVSKAVTRLEGELKVRLLNRSTRSVSLTADGTALYLRCKQILNDLEAAKLAMSQAQSAPTGTLRVSMPVAFGRSRVLPAIAAFLNSYPQVTVAASVTDRCVDIVEEGFDVVVRVGAVPDSRMVARALTSTHYVVAGSPRYLQEHPQPLRVEDLREHNCVGFMSAQTGKRVEWLFYEDGKACAHAPTGQLTLDDGESMVDAAVNHAGLIYCQDYMIDRNVADGKLKRLLCHLETPEWPIVAMYPQNRHLSPKVRVFVDFMVQHFADTGASTEPVPISHAHSV
jgi:LysR family transcriptional regulator for bpeEF and oprC